METDDRCDYCEQNPCARTTRGCDFVHAKRELSKLAELMRRQKWAYMREEIRSPVPVADRGR